MSIGLQEKKIREDLVGKEIITRSYNAATGESFTLYKIGPGKYERVDGKIIPVNKR